MISGSVTGFAGRFPLPTTDRRHPRTNVAQHLNQQVANKVGLPHNVWVWRNLCEIARASQANGLRLGQNDVLISHEKKERVGAWLGVEVLGLERIEGGGPCRRP
jgi:hypothetical protein